MQASDMVENKPQTSRIGGGVPEDALRVLGLAKAYRLGFWRRRRQAVDGLSMAVGTGKIFALLGPNGAGKTTTMKAILGLVHADAGQIQIFGVDHRDPSSRHRVGYLPENPAFYEHLTGLELMDYYARLDGLNAVERKRRIAELLDLVGLTNHSRLRLQKYSKGMSQRLGLAQCLLNDPDLLILDEPMSGLDPLGRRLVRDLLLEFKQRGKTILLSSHIVHDVEILADSVGIINDGRLHSLHELSACQSGPGFEVTLNDWRPDSEALMPPGLRGRIAKRRAGDRVTVTVPDLQGLRELLAVCQRSRSGVIAVATRQTDLEEVYLAAVSRQPQSGPDNRRGTALSTSDTAAATQVYRADQEPASQRMENAESNQCSGTQQLS